MKSHKRFREQVYPGNQQELHLRPFEAAFAAGATQVMPYYGMPIGTDWEECGFAFNEPVIKGLLRGRYGFDGIVCTDWYLLESTTVENITFGPNGYGLEHLTPTERLKAALDAEVDQFGGDDCAERVVDLVASGELSEARLDVSVRRILLEKFRLGLFENRYVDVDNACVVASDPEQHRLGEHAQAAALTLLKNDSALLPLAPGTKVYSENIDWEGLDTSLVHVATAADAGVNVIRVSAPYETEPDNALGDWFHAGSLSFPHDVVERFTRLSDHAPTIVVIYLERPAVLTEIEPHAVALIGEYGASDRVVLDAIQGKPGFSGTLPFDLPRSMEAIEKSREDVPFDTPDPLYRYGHRLTLHAVGQERPSAS